MALPAAGPGDGAAARLAKTPVRVPGLRLAPRGRRFCALRRSPVVRVLASKSDGKSKKPPKVRAGPSKQAPAPKKKNVTCTASFRGPAEKTFSERDPRGALQAMPAVSFRGAVPNSPSVPLGALGWPWFCQLHRLRSGHSAVLKHVFRA